MFYQNPIGNPETDRVSASAPSEEAAQSDQYASEAKYHMMLVPLMAIGGLPLFVFFSVFHLWRGSYFPGTVFTLLAMNCIVCLIWGRFIKELKKLARLNKVGLTIGFALLGLILASGLLSIDIYLVLPWVFTYPAIILLMMGERAGIIGAVSFTAAVISILFIVHLPQWSDATRLIFRVNVGFSLSVLLLNTLMAERSRVKIRNGLLKARNKYKASEERQRLTNEELRIEIQMRIQSEKMLAQSELRYRALFQESAVSLWEEDHSGIKKYLDDLPQEAIAQLEDYLNQNKDEFKTHVDLANVTTVNRATLKLYDAPNVETLMRNLSKILPSDLVGWSIERFCALYRDGNFQSQIETCTIRGRKIIALLSSTIPAGYESSWQKVYTSVYDITERVSVEEEKRRVEAQMHNTRQFQAIASLAGGIAHQFNNGLAAIIGSVDLLKMKTQDTPDTDPHFSTLQGSTERLRRLTEQLLAYAQGGKYQPTDFSVEKLISIYLKSDKRLNQDKVQIKTVFEDEIVLSQCDLTQIQMVLEAVLHNAVEAMQGSGEVTITSRKVHLTAMSDVMTAGLASGHYAQISITDNGAGMDEETCRRVFEPFFTTKFVGRGLGMAAAYGIVRNHDGMIQVASTPGTGTKVIIFLPCVSRVDQ